MSGRQASATDASLPRAVAQQGLLARAFDRVPVAVVLVAGDGRIVMANAQAEVVFKRPRAQFEGAAVETLVPERYRSAHPAYRDGFLRAPHARPMGAGRDLHALRADGSEFPVEIGLNPIDTEDGPMVLAAIVDITDRKHREESIAAALREKDLLLGEIHHRVKNNLQVVDSLLDLQASFSGDERLAGILADCQHRVRSMALIHQILYQSRDFARADFEAFLGSLVPMLIGAHAPVPESIVLTIRAENVGFPIDVAVPCGLIVNELVTNAIKHGLRERPEGHLRVEFESRSEGVVTLTVESDGNPLPPDFDVSASAGLGMTLINLLTRQIDGQLRVDSRDPPRFQIDIPLKASAP